MGKIVILDEITANKIAAGEVIERPASVVKELIENAIDAKADKITVEIKNGGISLIKVTDNGCGIDEDDAAIAFERHSTSKIRSAFDLESIQTLGFRGEALASIASVSNVELVTRVTQNQHGTYVHIQGGHLKEVHQTGCSIGTNFTISELFYNTPARFKFLKKDSTETGYISDMISRIAIGHPQISFRLINNGSTILHTPGNNDLKSVIYSIYGKEIANGLREVNYQDQKYKLWGFAGKSEIARANRNSQSVFINGRYIKSKLITSAIDQAYKTILLKNKFPFVVLCMEINPVLVDVNVHPTKMEVRFSEEQDTFRAVYQALQHALMSSSEPVDVIEGKKETYAFDQKEDFFLKGKYVQERLMTAYTTPTRPSKERFDRIVQDSKNATLSYREQNTSEKIEYKKHIAQIENIDNKNGIDTISHIDNSDTNGNIDFTEKRDTKVHKEYKENEINKKNETKETNEENDEKTREIKEFWEGARLIGQVFSTYILLQYDQEMILIDQHAAHERIMYDQLIKRYQNGETYSQEMISPISIEMTHQEVKFLEEEAPYFERLGFSYERFGNQAILLRTIPFMQEYSSVKELFLEIVDHISNIRKYNQNEKMDDTLYMIACKMAIKANKRLEPIEINSLLEELQNLDNPFTCPHGRPTIVKIKKTELEKMFKRIL